MEGKHGIETQLSEYALRKLPNGQLGFLMKTVLQNIF